MSTRELLDCRDFMRLWWARLAGVSASQMLLVAIGWQMYDLTGSAWDLGLVGLLQFLPALALVLVAGHVVDRHHRARIVALCVAAQGLVALVLAAAPFDGLSQRTLLLALSVVLGAVRAFQMPAQQALVPLLVPARAAAARHGLQFGRAAGRDHCRPGAGRLRLRGRRVGGVWPVRGAVRRGGWPVPAHPPRRPAARRARQPGHAARRRALRAAEQGGAGRDLARPVRGAARRRRGAAADLRQGHPAGRPLGPGAAARRARAGRAG